MWPLRRSQHRYCLFDGKAGMYWVGWDVGMRRVLGQVLELEDSIDRLGALTIYFADLFWELERGVVEGCGGAFAS